MAGDGGSVIGKLNYLFAMSVVKTTAALCTRTNSTALRKSATNNFTQSVSIRVLGACTRQHVACPRRGEILCHIWSVFVIRGYCRETLAASRSAKISSTNQLVEVGLK